MILGLIFDDLIFMKSINLSQHRKQIKNHMDDAYISYISQLAHENKSVVFFNSGPKHASFVMSTIFSKAKHTVKIFAGNLDGPVSKNRQYKEELEDFLNRDGKLEILLQEYNIEKEFNLKNMLSYHLLSGNMNIKIKKVNATVIDTRNNKEVHFSVADDTMYRLETDLKKYIAEGNFNDKVAVKNLVSTFDKMYQDNSSIEINLI